MERQEAPKHQGMALFGLRRASLVGDVLERKRYKKDCLT